MNASATKKAANAAKSQATLDASNNQRQAELSLQNADITEANAQLNARTVLAVSGINTSLTSAVADANINLVNATTDFNVSAIKATSDFNATTAEGAAALLEARGEMEAVTHRANAAVLEVQAQDTLEAGNQAERQSRTAYAVLKGQQRARLAANGVTLDEGSSLRIQSDTDYASDVDADVIKTNAMKGAFGYRTQARNEEANAAFASIDGKSAAAAKRAEAVSIRINASVGVAQAQLEGSIKNLNTKMTASYDIIQDQMNAKVQADNILQQGEADAWAMRAQAEGYTGQAAQSTLTANSIHPKTLAATSLVSGAANLASKYVGYGQAGVFG